MNRGTPFHYADSRTGKITLRNPQLEGKPIINVPVDGENVFQVLANCDQAMKDHGLDLAERRAIIKELSNVHDHEMFHARLRFYFTVLADQFPIINAQAATRRNPYIADCDNCDDEGICPDYREGAAPGATMSCDACGG